MLGRSFGGVTSALSASRGSSTIAYIRGRTTSSALAGYARDFLPTARPFLSLRAPSSRFIRPRLVREPAFQTSFGVTTFGASWSGFVNQKKSTAPAELSRLFGERNGRKPHRITACRPPDVTCDVRHPRREQVSGEFLSEPGDGILRRHRIRVLRTESRRRLSVAPATPPNSRARPQPAPPPPPERPKADVTSRSPTDYPQV